MLACIDRNPRNALRNRDGLRTVLPERVVIGVSDWANEPSLSEAVMIESGEVAGAFSISGVSERTLVPETVSPSETCVMAPSEASILLFSLLLKEM